MKILVVGESCQDKFVYGIVERLAPESPVPVFEAVRSTATDGMAMNVKKNVEALGVKCDIWTNSNWENVVKARYIDDRTNHMFIRVDENDKTISNIGLSEEKLGKLHSYNAIIISDYNKGFLSIEDIEKIGSAHPLVLLDSKKPLGPWCRDINYIKINGFEYERSKKAVEENNKDKLVVTLGNRGCLYNGITYPVKEVEVKDVAGAGDTFISAMAVGLLQNQNIAEVLTFANECATVVVQKRGTSTV